MWHFIQFLHHFFPFSRIVLWFIEAVSFGLLKAITFSFSLPWLCYKFSESSGSAVSTYVTVVKGYYVLLLAVRIQWRRRAKVHWRVPAGRKMTRVPTVSEYTRKTRRSSTTKVHSLTSLATSTCWKQPHQMVLLCRRRRLYEVPCVSDQTATASRLTDRHAVMSLCKWCHCDCGDGCWGNHVCVCNCLCWYVCVNVVKDNSDNCVWDTVSCAAGASLALQVFS